ncbi:MAG: hypothetical protein A2096_16130 [Spirochaetes bacterium GWF1_41_5]|nr:MAG: hypothetical protein A2096_16130 [Spirochaetes bacterium GWF1_41_5]
MTDLAVEKFSIGHDILFTIYSTSSWALRDRVHSGKKLSGIIPPTAPKNFNDYRDFVYALAHRYRGKVAYYQIENEVYGAKQFWFGTEAEYFQLLETGSEAVRKADPDAKILPASIALGEIDITSLPNDTRFRQGYDFLLKTYSVYAHCFDIADIHLYYTPEAIPDRLKWLKGIMISNNYEKPIWVTETGGLDPRAFSKKEYAHDNLKKQAVDIVKKYILCFANGAERVFYLSVQKNKDKEHPQFGNMRLTEDYKAEYKRPAYFSYKLMVQKIGGFSSVSVIPCGYKFIVNGKPVLALWSETEKTIDVSFFINKDEAVITSIITAKEKRDPLITKVASGIVTVSNIPIFVE